MHRVDLCQLPDLRLPCLKEIPSELLIHPESFSVAEVLCKTQRSTRCNPTLLIDYLIHALSRYADAISKLPLSQIHWFKKFLEQHLARMCWL